jgi:hypothetical protein
MLGQRSDGGRHVIKMLIGMAVWLLIAMLIGWLAYITDTMIYSRVLGTVSGIMIVILVTCIAAMLTEGM